MGTATLTEAPGSIERATEIRSRRAAQRRRFVELGAPAALRAAAVIVSNPDDWARSWKVYGLLAAIPATGPYRAYRAMQAAHIPDNLVIDELNTQQRHDLCLWLEKRAAGWRRVGG